MLRVSRWALVALVAVVTSLLPFGVSWADPGRGNGRDEPPAHGRQEEPDQEESTEDEEQPSQEQSETESEDEAEADPSPSPSSEPSPSSRPSRLQSNQDQSEDPDGVIDASFSVSPASISVGETSTLQVDLTNPTDSVAVGVEVLVDLPAELDLVSSDLPYSESGSTLRIALGDLAPGATVTSRTVVLALETAAGGLPVRFAVMADGHTFHHELIVSVDEVGSEGLTLFQSSPLLVQVGDVAPFSVTVSNDSDLPLQDVSVVTEIAPEIDVVGVAPIDAADAVQLGSSPGGEDIVWIFHSLDPGEQVELTWSGRAVAPGDLEAANVVAATLQGEVAAASRQNTYLGFVEGVQTDRSVPPTPVVREKVVTKLVPVTSEVAAAVGGGVLPITGWSPLPLGIGGALLIGLGALLMWEPKRRSSKRLSLVLVGGLLLLGTACVSDEGPTSGEAAPEVSTSPSAEPTDEVGEEKDEPEDQVLGIRLHRPEAEAGGTPPSDEVAPTETPPPVTTEVVMEEVSEVITVVVPVADLPLEPLSSRPGDNTLSFSWAPGADLQATSSRIITSDATEEILVAVSGEGDSLSATITITNLADDRRLQVDGRLALEITSADGRTSSLVSDPIHATLDPGAQTTANLTFSLPSGSFSARGAFQAD